MRHIALTIDAYRHLEGAQAEEPPERVYCRVEDVPSDYDVIFITNPTAMHLETLRRFHEKGKHFFIEKPVVSVDEVSSAEAFVRRRDSVYYVACPLRYNAVIQYIRTNVDAASVRAVRSISSSYLPDWRPGQDYRNTYSAHKAKGGGVSTDLIHEWDYLSWLFGWPQKVYSLIGRCSLLEIDSDDYAVYIAAYADKIAELHLDYFGRKTIRRTELFTGEDTIIGDIAANRISYMVSGKTIDFCEGRDDYQKRELEYFLDVISGKMPPTDYFGHSIRVLRLTQGDIGQWNR